MTDDSPPAFPLADVMGHVTDGMSLRVYIAVQAMAAMVANPDISAHAAAMTMTPADFRTDVVRSAYEMADLMLDYAA